MGPPTKLGVIYYGFFLHDTQKLFLPFFKRQYFFLNTTLAFGRGVQVMLGSTHIKKMPKIWALPRRGGWGKGGLGLGGGGWACANCLEHFFIEGGNSLSFHYMGTTGVLQEYCV